MQKYKSNQVFTTNLSRIALGRQLLNSLVPFKLFIAVLFLSFSSSVVGSPGVQKDGLKVLEGEWIYVKDLTEDRALERMGPPMSTSSSLGLDEGAVILVRGHGSGHRNVRIAYELSADGTLNATIGFTIGGYPKRFEFKREDN